MHLMPFDAAAEDQAPRFSDAGSSGESADLELRHTEREMQEEIVRKSV